MSTPEEQNSQGSTSKSLHIFTAPCSDQKLSMDPQSPAWTSTIDLLSVLFNLGKLVPANAMTSLSLRYTRSKHLLEEALFAEPVTRVKATSNGLVYQNTRIVSSPTGTAPSPDQMAGV
ncbi:hypothetical protein CLU79DRAFT_891174 [Phycomyces nitens]|nr:hypothetical protein CLU79DRAFT_891174 [Phycomyces nitens]